MVPSASMSCRKFHCNSFGGGTQSCRRMLVAVGMVVGLIEEQSDGFPVPCRKLQPWRLSWLHRPDRHTSSRS